MDKYRVKKLEFGEYVIQERLLLLFWRTLVIKKSVKRDTSDAWSREILMFHTEKSAQIECKFLNERKLTPITHLFFRKGELYNIVRK